MEENDLLSNGKLVTFLNLILFCKNCLVSDEGRFSGAEQLKVRNRLFPGFAVEGRTMVYAF